MDDITSLEKMSDNVVWSDLYLFDTRPGIEYRIANMKGFTGQQEFIAPNPPYGVIINYFLKTKPQGKDPVRITITDKAGSRIRELNGPAEAGINRIAWDLRYDAPARPQTDGAPAEGGGGNRGPYVDPGEYMITVAAAGKTASTTASVEQDPRVAMLPEIMTQRRQAITRLYGMMRDADAARRKIVALRTSLTNLTEGWKRPGAPQVPEAVKHQADAMLANAKEVAGKFEVQRDAPLGNAGPPLKWTPPPMNQKIGRLLNAIDSYTGTPPSRQLTDIDTALADLKEGLAAVSKLTGEDLQHFNKMMAEAGVPYVTADTGPASPQR
jgi:hypothetical protein